MCQDLLEVSEQGVVERDFRAAGGAGGVKADSLSDEDAIFQKYKHKHIGEITEELADEFKQFQDSSGVADFQKLKAGGGHAEFKDMTRVVKELPRYTKQQEKYSMHISLTGRLVKTYQERSLPDICKLEMEMLFGEDAAGSNVLGGGVLQAAGTLRGDAGRVLRDAREPDRARLLALLQLTQPQLAAELLEAGELAAYPAEHTEVEATVARLANASSGVYATRGWKTDREDFPGYSKGRETTMDETSRYKPACYWAANDAIDPTKGLDTRAFPYCGEDPGPGAVSFTSATRSERSGPSTGAGKSWKGGGRRGGGKTAGPRLIIFVAGGIGFAECRTAYEISKKFPGAQVLIGSTELLTPEKALQRYEIWSLVFLTFKLWAHVLLRILARRLKCAPPTREELEYESASLDGGGAEGGVAMGEPSALDAFLDMIPFEKVFPCCFKPEVRSTVSNAPLG